MGKHAVLNIDAMCYPASKNALFLPNFASLWRRWRMVKNLVTASWRYSGVLAVALKLASVASRDSSVVTETRS